jgi:2-haloacid dehalogenase
LIDWRAGIENALREMMGRAAIRGMDEMFDTYVRTEAEVEATGYQSYRQVLRTVMERLGPQAGLAVSAEQVGLLAERLPEWTPFPDTNKALARLKERYRLGVLSNVDRDLFAATAAHFDITFDFVVTAEDVRSYKPDVGHFERLLEEHAERDTVLHVAQSLYHDGAPTTRLGIPFVWINRYGEANETDVHPLAEYPDLKSFAEAACA